MPGEMILHFPSSLYTFTAHLAEFHMPESSHELEQLFYQHVAQTSPASTALPIERAEGIYLYGANGEKWIDFISGICVSNVGHAAPEVIEAIQQQTSRYLHTHVYGEAVLAPQVQYATRLSEVLGEGLDYVYFGNSGAEANEGAMKVAKRYTGRQKIIAFENAYHGSTHGALSVSGNPEMRRGYGPFLPRIHFLPYNELSALEEVDRETAAVIIEAIQGAGGGIVPDEGYLQAVRQRCDEVGALMILDEIQTGFGRTGSLFAHQSLGFQPDILTLAKALGGGLPLGAFVTCKEVIEVIQSNPVLGHINTYGGGPVSCAAGLALLNKIIDENLVQQVAAKEALLLEHLKHPDIKALRGRGLLYAVLFENYEKAEKVRKAALKNGLLTIGFLNIDNGLRISPPLTITDVELVDACQRFVAAMNT